MLRAPELQLSKEEAEEYAQSVAMVARHYDVGASAKTLDWINLGTTMASIYGLRAMAVVGRRRGDRAAPGADVPPMRNGHDTAPAQARADGGEFDWSSIVPHTPRSVQ